MSKNDSSGDGKREMASIDAENLVITGAHRKFSQTKEDLHLKIKDDVLIIVTQAYGPTGHNLVGISDVSFDGYPAITLKIRCEAGEGLVHLSPLHGDARKAGFTDIPKGMKCELFCPISGQKLDALGKLRPDSDAEYFALYLTPKPNPAAMIAISDIWGDYDSRIVDHNELISYWSAMGKDDEE